ncbi:MAG: DUF2147 domain-containing protein [Candidatus Cloacimonetes bacterium]|nr:DUF2147 domain-containing protein [Candidatus Cloacimonadota bacterium]
MKKTVLIILSITLLLPLCLISQTNEGDRILGVWFNGGKTSKIEIFRTTAGNYAGRIVWLKEPNDAKGKPKVDHKNPNDALQSRPLIGLVIVTGLEYKGKSNYGGGKIYDPKSGNTYSSKGELVDHNTLKLRGYIGVSLIGRTDTWTRTQK